MRSLRGRPLGIANIRRRRQYSKIYSLNMYWFFAIVELAAQRKLSGFLLLFFSVFYRLLLKNML